MSGIDRVRIMVLGDSGVGKTSFLHMAANGESIRSPGWTVGCSVEVKLHEYKEGMPGQVTYFVELWDVGGSANHSNSRPVFYTPCHGVILVHDLTNRKSEQNLFKWFAEIISKENSLKDQNAGFMSLPNFDEADPEKIIGSIQMPILVIGTKLDLVDDRKSAMRTSRIAAQFDAEEILLDSMQTRYLAAGTTNAVKLSRFYDRVIEKQYYSKNSQPHHERYTSLSPNLPPRFYATTHQN